MATTKYIEGIGRRKTATARVRITPAATLSVTINNRPHTEYFKSPSQQKDMLSVLSVSDAGIETYEVSAHVSGGGLSAQAEAIRLGIARALVKEKNARRVPLKRAGYLKRDARSVERKKFGLRKARKSGQWSKR